MPPPLNAFTLPRLGAGWMLVAGGLFAVMGACAKLGAERFSSAELVFYRSAFGLVAILIGARLPAAGRRLPALATCRLRLHLGRSLSGFIALLLFFYALGELPLATGMTLNYTSPLFLGLLSGWLLKRPVGRRLGIPLALGFVGVVLLLQPHFHAGDWLAGLAGLASGFLAGLAYVHVRQLTEAGEPAVRIVFYFTLVSTASAGLWAAVSGWHAVDVGSLAVLLALGASATLAQFALTHAYRVGNALVVASLAHSTVVFAGILGVWWFGERLDGTAGTGVGLIVLAGVASVVAGRRAG